MVKNLLFIFAMLLAVSASGQNVYVVTNDVLDSTHEALTGTDTSGRLTVWIVQAGAAVDVSAASNTLTVADTKDGYVLQTAAATVLDATNGNVRFLLSARSAGTYLLTGTCTPYGNPESAFTFARHTIVLTSATASASCPDVTLNITNINNYSGDTFSTNLLESLANVDVDSAPTTDDALVWNGTAWSNAPIESGSGTLTNGTGTNGITVTVDGDTFTAGLPSLISSSDQFLRSDGDSVFWSTDRWPLPEIGTNWVRFEYVADEPQFWTVPSGVTNVEFTVIGGAGQATTGTGGGGGGTRIVYDVSGIQTVRWVIAGRALSVNGWSTYFGGGTTIVAAAAGGGLSGAMDDATGEWLCIAGGGGGTRNGGGGAGGGLSGGDGDGAYGGRGGTQSAGGLGSQGQTNELMGQFLCGGTSTNSNTGSGGGGYFGGGAGGPNLTGYNMGGGGSGYISTNAIWGVTVRGMGGYPPFMDDPLYVPGCGVSSAGPGLGWAKW